MSLIEIDQILAAAGGAAGILLLVVVAAAPWLSGQARTGAGRGPGAGSPP